MTSLSKVQHEVQLFPYDSICMTLSTSISGRGSQGYPPNAGRNPADRAWLTKTLRHAQEGLEVRHLRRHRREDVPRLYRFPRPLRAGRARATADGAGRW